MWPHTYCYVSSSFYVSSPPVCPHTTICVLILVYTGHSNDEVNAALIKALEKGTSFGAPSLNENVLAQMVLKKN